LGLGGNLGLNGGTLDGLNLGYGNHLNSFSGLINSGTQPGLGNIGGLNALRN